MHNLLIVLLLLLGINWMERICSESSKIRDVVGHLDDGISGMDYKTTISKRYIYKLGKYVLVEINRETNAK